VEDKYLIDTHVLLWLSLEPENIPAKALEILTSGKVVYFSYASVWEMAIKIKSGKLEIGASLKDFVQKAIVRHCLELMPITLQHLYYTDNLENHHRDPFDRLLIAQAAVEQIALISADKIIDSYNIQRIWK
jgi:PIN domain nuclease of toxin-antitoxin system